MKIKELYEDVITENLEYEFKAILNQDNPVKWAKTIVAYSNGDGGIIFVGVSNDREAFGLSLEEIDKTKNLVGLVNDRHIFPHARFSFMMRSVDENAERFVLAIRVKASDSVVRYHEGDFNETVYIKGDGSATVATPEDIISQSGRKKGVDNAVTDVSYEEEKWTDYLSLCKEYRGDGSIPNVKELQNEEIVSSDGFAKTGLLMFKDGYNDDNSLICCRLWKGKTKSGTVIDTQKYKGPLSGGLRTALSFIERNTKNGWKKTKNGGREELRAYPKEAIREAMVNAIAHRDYTINGTQIDVDIYDDRIDIVSPGSWLLPQPYESYQVGSIPSIRRNQIIAACLDIANLMERGGTGFQTMIDCYKSAGENKQPIVMIYPGFLDLRLFDCLYDNHEISASLSDKDRVIELLQDCPKTVKELQEALSYANRSRFLKQVINPLINEGIIYRDGAIKSPTATLKIK